MLLAALLPRRDPGLALASNSHAAAESVTLGVPGRLADGRKDSEPGWNHDAQEGSTGGAMRSTAKSPSAIVSDSSRGLDRAIEWPEMDVWNRPRSRML